MFVIHRLLLVVGACCLWVNPAQAVVSSGQISAQLVITAGCEVSPGSAASRPLVRCSTASDSPTEFTLSTEQAPQEDGSPRTLVTLNW